MPNSVKYFTSAMSGAPVLSGTAGALLSVLDSCLVDGFDVKVVTGGAIAGGVATLTFAGSHSSQVGTVILVAGAAPAGINGEQRVTAKASGNVSFLTEEADGPITGSVTIKMAPLGWTKPFTGSNKRAYRPSDPTATGCYLRVDDSSATNPRVVGYETMSDIDTGRGAFPSEAQAPGGAYWPKSNAADATARPWFVVGDGKLFYIYTASYSIVTDHGCASAFGDPEPVRSGDAYCCFLTGGTVSLNTIGGLMMDCMGYGGTNLQTLWWDRHSSGLGGCVQGSKTGVMCTTSGAHSGKDYHGTYFTYPNAADNGLILTPVLGVHSATVRAAIPGIFHTPQTMGSFFSTLDIVDGTGEFAGKRLLAWRTGGTGTSAYGVAFFDVTGPWRA